MSYINKLDPDFDSAMEYLTAGPPEKQPSQNIIQMLDADSVSTVEGTLKACEILLENSPDESTNKQTLVVNLFAGPGARKTTVLHGIVNKLNWLNIRTESAMEVAKDMIWDKRTEVFRDQLYMFGKMYHRIFRLLGQLEVIVTDSPILLTPIYDTEHRNSLLRLSLNEHNKMRTYNVFLNRTSQYDPIGRNQTEEESKIIDRRILELLDVNQIPYEVFHSYEGCESGIVRKIQLLLGK